MGIRDKREFTCDWCGFIWLTDVVSMPDGWGILSSSTVSQCFCNYCVERIVERGKQRRDEVRLANEEAGIR